MNTKISNMETFVKWLLRVSNTLITFALILILFLMFTSCDTLKKTVKNQEDRKLTESTTVLTKRVGDTVRYEVPKITYKDTTIVKTNYVTGTTQTVRYNDQGMIDLVECQSGTIEELKRTNRELIEAIKEKDKTKEVEFNSEIIIYAMLGLLGIVLILAFFGFKLVSKNSELIRKIIP